MNITYAKYIDENGDLTTAEKASYLNIKIDNGELKWKTLSLLESGFAIDGEVRDIKILKGEGDKKFVLVSKNNENLDLFSF